MKLSERKKQKIFYKYLKFILIIIFLGIIIYLKSEVYANEDEIGVYGKDFFGEEYSNGYIRNCTDTDIIGTSSGVILNSYYTSNNTSKSEYIDYSKAARYVTNDGEAKYLDLRLYIWTNNKNYPWTIMPNRLCVYNSYSGTQHTTMEFHFYTIGHCGEDEYEQSFKGVICLNDLDIREGFLVYQGYNKFYLQSGIPITYIEKGSKNSTSTNNPFNTSGIAEYSYFFGNRNNNDTDGVWIEIDSTPKEPFKFIYGKKGGIFGMDFFYTGTAIEYYVDGELKDRSYCVPYGRYTLIDTLKVDTQKYDYEIDGWYTDTNYSMKVSNGIAGESTIKVFGKFVKKRYTITVQNEMPGHTYNAYQLFTGNYAEGKNDKNENVPVLSNINWGAEFQRYTSTEPTKTYGDKLLEKLKEESKKDTQNKTIYDTCNTAEDVAKILKEKKADGEEAREFVKIVGEFIKENNIPITKGTNTQVSETVDGVEKKNYKITDLKPGYYIVIDEKANLDENDAYSRYLLDIVKDVTMIPKSAIPTLYKKVTSDNINKVVTETVVNSENEVQEKVVTNEIDYTRNTAMYKPQSETYNAEDYDINFELISSIPIRIDGYKQYDYEIVDILSKGFDIDKNSIKVKIGGKEYSGYTVAEPIKIAEANYEANKEYFKEKGTVNPQDYYGKTIVLIKFNDLVPQIKDGTILEGQEVLVTYNAKLNSEALTGKNENVNEAYLMYTSNPYDASQKATTNPSKTYTYTVELDLSKIAEIKKVANSENNETEAEGTETPVYEYLGGAKFEIYDAPEYVINAGTGNQEKNTARNPIATITSSELEANKGFATFKSLKAGTYYLKEVEAPEGYNKLKEEIEFEVKAEYKNSVQVWKVEDKTTSKLVEIKMDDTGNRIKMQIQNTSGFQLPATGGVGTIVFTVAGLSLMALAVISLKSNKKKIK